MLVCVRLVANGHQSFNFWYLYDCEYVFIMFVAVDRFSFICIVHNFPALCPYSTEAWNNWLKAAIPAHSTPELGDDVSAAHILATDIIFWVSWVSMSFSMMIIMTSFPDVVHGMKECSVCKDCTIDVPTFPIGSVSHFTSCLLLHIFGKYVWTLGCSTSQRYFQKTHNSSFESYY